MHLLTGSRRPVSLPNSVDINMSDSDSVKSVSLAPDLTNIPFTKATNKITLDLTGVAQGAYDTIIVITSL